MGYDGDPKPSLEHRSVAYLGNDIFGVTIGNCLLELDHERRGRNISPETNHESFCGTLDLLVKGGYASSITTQTLNGRLRPSNADILVVELADRIGIKKLCRYREEHPEQYIVAISESKEITQLAYQRGACNVGIPIINCNFERLAQAIARAYEARSRKHKAQVTIKPKGRDLRIPEEVRLSPT